MISYFPETMKNYLFRGLYLIFFLSINFISMGQSHKSTSLTIAEAKLSVSNNIDENVKSIKQAIDFANKEKADILLTPEGSLSGYTSDFDQSHVLKALKEVLEYAQKAGIGLALGTCFVEPGNSKCYNQIRLYNKQGE